MVKQIIISVFLMPMLWQSAAAQGNNRISLSIGVAGIGDETTLAESRFEYRFQKQFLIFSPMGGLMVFGDGSKYLFAGFNIARYFNRLMIAPNFAFGAFHNGGEKDLGGIIEFRSGLEIGYQVIDKLMLGIAFHHISNASIYPKNPGTETLSFIMTIGSRQQKKTK